MGVYYWDYDYYGYGMMFWDCDYYGCDGYSWDEMAEGIEWIYNDWYGWGIEVECDYYGCYEYWEGEDYAFEWYDWEYYVDLYYDFIDSYYYYDYEGMAWDCDYYGCDGYSWEEMAYGIEWIYNDWYGWDITVDCDYYGCIETFSDGSTEWYDWEYYVDLYYDFYDAYMDYSSEDSYSSDWSDDEYWKEDAATAPVAKFSGVVMAETAKAETINLETTVAPEVESNYNYMAYGAMGGAALIGGLIYANKN